MEKRRKTATDERDGPIFAQNTKNKRRWQKRNFRQRRWDSIAVRFRLFEGSHAGLHVFDGAVIAYDAVCHERSLLIIDCCNESPIHAKYPSRALIWQSNSEQTASSAGCFACSADCFIV